LYSRAIRPYKSGNLLYEFLNSSELLKWVVIYCGASKRIFGFKPPGPVPLSFITSISTEISRTISIADRENLFFRSLVPS
jgi:hypothetical protein